ncbi:MAG: S1 family peptidase, partial [Primorskyibacter sp.]
YNATTDLGVRVLLISQPGDRNTLNGLYEIMQTLEIVPRTGPRSKKRDSFRLVGENDRIISHTEASLKNGQIKGFTLVWPAGDEERRGRVLTQMQRSFAREAGVLDSAILDDTAPTVNLVAGLRVRTPRLTRTGFFVAQNGTVVTSVDAVAGCARVTLDRDFDAQVVAQDTASGLAVVRAQGGLAPVGRAELARTQPRRSLEIAVAGYPYGAVLNAPTLTFGRVADVTGLSGEPDLMRLDMDALPGDAGGPIIDRSGAVVGVLLPEADTMRRLPAGVSLAANTNALRALLDQAGVRPNTSQRGTDLPPEDLSILVRDLTVLVNCWDS